MKKTNTPAAPAAIAMIEVETLATLSSFSARRIHQLAQEGKLPGITNGQLPMIEALRALFSWLQRDSESLQQEKLKLLTSQRKISEREERISAALEDQSYVPVATVDRLVQICVSKLELLPVKIESEFGLAQNITTRITELLDEARSAIAKDLRHL